jgi:outer membrane protein with beta-barrel domain
MVRSLVAGAVAGLLLAAAPKAPLAAQSTGLGITPYAGYMKFGKIVNGPFGTSVRSAGAPVYGAELQLGLVPGLALIGNVAYAKSDLEIGAPIVGGLSVGESSALMYDAGLRLRLPMSGLVGISPFIQAGAGAMRQNLRLDPVATHATNFAYNVGGGVDLGLAPRLGMQLMVKDYIGKFDAKEATSVAVNDRTTHNWSVSAGLRLGL